MNKIRINITVDKDNLDKAKTKLMLFGGKLSTLFNAYLSDFVSSIDKQLESNHKVLEEKNKELESRLKKIEEKLSKKK
ncbi:MAG: hypothetical protein Q8L29_02230 [archaeon]|nr:hypothetical protein [archaeon]